MKHTVTLNIRGNQRLPEGRLNIHPNEGFDLGLMTTHYSLPLENSGLVEIWLLNDCPRETLEINPKLWEKLGSFDKVVLQYDGETLSLRKP